MGAGRICRSVRDKRLDASFARAAGTPLVIFDKTGYMLLSRARRLPSWLRLILTFIVPVAFAVTAPAEALTARLTPQTLALALGLTVFALAG